MNKKSFSFRLLAALTIFTLIQPAFALDIGSSQLFQDVQTSNPDFTAIMDLKSRGIINGYPDGTFKPDQQVNRVEALKLILGASKIEIPTDAAIDLAGLKDVKGNQWYAPYLSKALSMGVVEGYPDATFKPTQTVNLVENLKILLKAENVDLSGVTDLYTNPYKDVEYWGWYTPYLAYAGGKNLIVADANGNIYPDQGMTRGKLTELIYKLIFIQERKINSFPNGEMILTDADEPIIFSIKNLNVSVFKNTTPAKEFFDPQKLNEAAYACGKEFQTGLYEDIIGKMNGNVTTYTFVQNKAGEVNQFQANIMPNSVHYENLQSFKSDFNVCTPGGIYPAAVTDKWLLSTGNCDGTTDTKGCSEIMTAIGGEVKLK